MGTAMNNRENGSWLGVMMAAKVVMPTAAHRRTWRSWQVLMTPDQQQEHEEDRELEGDAERREHQHHERQVLVGVDQGPELVPADAEQERQGLGDREPGHHAAEHEQHDRREQEPDAVAALAAGAGPAPRTARSPTSRSAR